MIFCLNVRDWGHEPIVTAPDENLSRNHQVVHENLITVLGVRTGKIKSATIGVCTLSM